MYGYTNKITLSFEEADKKVREELQKEGFGILTEIDIQATLKKKLDVDLEKYTILGACNPPYAHKALLAEKEIGLLLPCNVIIYQNNDKVNVSAILPTRAMSIVDNPKLVKIAEEIEAKLKKVIDSL